MFNSIFKRLSPPLLCAAVITFRYNAVTLNNAKGLLLDRTIGLTD